MRAEQGARSEEGRYREYVTDERHSSATQIGDFTTDGKPIGALGYWVVSAHGLLRPSPEPVGDGTNACRHRHHRGNGEVVCLALAGGPVAVLSLVARSEATDRCPLRFAPRRARRVGEPAAARRLDL